MKIPLYESRCSQTQIGTIEVDDDHDILFKDLIEGKLGGTVHMEPLLDGVVLDLIGD